MICRWKNRRTPGSTSAVGVGLWAIAGAVAVIAISIAAPSDAWSAAWFISLCVFALVIGLAGTAFVLGPFRGWNLPLTAATKLARPDLKISELSIYAMADKIPRGGAAVIVHVGLMNEGGGDIERATLRFLTPDSATRECAVTRKATRQETGNRTGPPRGHAHRRQQRGSSPWSDRLSLLGGA
jgi:hypothetical protein